MKASTPQLKDQHIKNYTIASVAPEVVFWGSFAHRLGHSNKSKQVLVGNVGTNASSFGSRPHDIINCTKKEICAKGALMPRIRQYSRRLQPWNSTMLVLQKPA
jgi:hypothetical protein